MTERFIPIGQSPGLSGTVTFIGTVDSIERTDMIITVRNQNQSRRAKVTEFTNIWLDLLFTHKSSDIYTPAQQISLT